MSIEQSTLQLLQAENASLRRDGKKATDLLDSLATIVGSKPADPDALRAAVLALKDERDAWKGTHDGQQRVYNDIGANLGADMPRELVNEVARRRMAELAAAREALNRIRSAGSNCNNWATWAQRTAAWGMAPDKWPEQTKDAPEEKTE